MTRTGKQGTGVSPGISVRTLTGREQLPCGAGLFPLFPLEATGEQIKGVDLLRVSQWAGLKIGAIQISARHFAWQWLIKSRRAPSHGEIGVIAWATKWFGQWYCYRFKKPIRRG